MQDATSPGMSVTETASPVFSSHAVRVALYRGNPGGAHLMTTLSLPPLEELDGDAGIRVEDLLTVVIRGLEIAQRGPFKSRAQALAITKLEEAVHWLNARQLTEREITARMQKEKYHG